MVELAVSENSRQTSDGGAVIARPRFPVLATVTDEVRPTVRTRSRHSRMIDACNELHGVTNVRQVVRCQSKTRRPSAGQTVEPATLGRLSLTYRPCSGALTEVVHRIAGKVSLQTCVHTSRDGSFRSAVWQTRGRTRSSGNARSGQRRIHRETLPIQRRTMVGVVWCNRMDLRCAT
jgi:hypothetical protein